MTYGENSKPGASSDKYRDNYDAIKWPKKKKAKTKPAKGDE